MPTDLTFTEEWLRDYERRTGKRGHEQNGGPLPPAESGEKRRSKYGNRKTTYAGRTFDSAHEAEIYRQMELRVRAGELRGVACQVAFILPGGVKYVADFVTLNTDGTWSVLDAKSEATSRDKAYRIKRKLMAECLGIEIEEV